MYLLESLPQKPPNGLDVEVTLSLSRSQLTFVYILVSPDAH